jgi:tagatose-1,6-bisphosphate aldolase
MAVWARFADGAEVTDSVFRMLWRYAPGGTLDVFASDQHSSYLGLFESYLEHTGQVRRASDDDVREVCCRFAAALGGVPSAALFNSLAYLSPGFRELLGERTMLIGRLEDTNTVEIDGGRGHLAQLAVQPEEVAGEVDGFKTLVKLDPDHQESWERNREWLAAVCERCRALGKPVFNETLISRRPGEGQLEMARRLPEGLVRMAEDFGALGEFYKTQVPVLWADGGDGTVVRVSSPDEVRSAAVTVYSTVSRPMLLLSAAVDFEQYAAQYALVCDLFVGPMCGRAYFKEAFTDPGTRDLDSLAGSFARMALPRMRQVQRLARRVSLPWWHRFSWLAEEARVLIGAEGRRDPDCGGAGPG